MHPALKPLSGMDDLDRALAATDERPLLLFKHSFTCGVSAEALDELIDHLNADIVAAGVPDPRYAIVTVQTHRDVSNAVAARLGVRHETPQAIKLLDVLQLGQIRVHPPPVYPAVLPALRSFSEGGSCRLPEMP